MILAIDLGGTYCRMAVFNNGNIVNQKKIESPASPQELVELVVNFSKENYPISRIGVGAPGFWDNDCVLRQSINLPNYIGYPIWSEISSRLKIPCYLKTDVELAAMGEAIFGQNNQYQNLLYINIGTGLGATLYKDGQIFSTEYSPTLRLEFMVYPLIENQEHDEKLKSIAILSSTITNLACILAPQIICFGGGKIKKNWDEIIAPAINNAQDYLSKVLTYPIKIEKAKLEYPTLYGAYQLANQKI
ncbi:glukinase [Planctomyces bekefii]|uniref:Glukinase n=1 Tax=Planctomyces bekefii TaxID=1653850 RepID=A0A5C6M2W3_9PLAN|nr:glukinase [Planctomyces bekefii]